MFMKLLEIDPQEIKIEDLSVLYPEYSAVSISDTKLAVQILEVLSLFAFGYFNTQCSVKFV